MISAAKTVRTTRRSSSSGDMRVLEAQEGPRIGRRP
jgi:hypothetical protein